MNLHFNLRAPKNNYMDRYTCTFPSLADGMAMAFSCREWALQRRDICTVDSSNLYSFKGIKLLEHATFDDEHQSTRGFPYPDGNVVHIGIGESARWLALMIKSCTFRKFCFLRFRSIFFSGALWHSTSSSLFEGFLGAPGSGLLHALLKPLVWQSWKVSEQSVAIAIIFFFQVFSIYEPTVYHIWAIHKPVGQKTRRENFEFGALCAHKSVTPWWLGKGG